jgi:hypothetical protein
MTHTIDVSRGELVSTVSQQWASRPDDQKFTSLSSLRDRVRLWADESHSEIILPSDIRAIGGDDGVLSISLAGTEVLPSHWSFEQIASAADAPSQYLRRLPASLAAQNLNHGLQRAEAKPISAYVRQNGVRSLRGLTSVRYGRIVDADVVEAVMKVAGDGTGDTRWKVPGTIDWSGAHGVSYNPNVEITKQTTTLYASDRDVFMFLVDDLNPIEVGKLRNGEPDLMFRGFYVWNSEVGSRTFGFASMYLRGVCQNRNLWGVEGLQQIVFKHTTYAPERFVSEASPALVEFANGSTTRLIRGVEAAKKAIVARTDEDRLEFLARYGFSKKLSLDVIDTVEIEESTRPESVWDFAQGITAVARKADFQDARLKLETIAGRMLDKVAVPA